MNQIPNIEETYNTKEVEEVLETYLTGTSIHEHFRQVQRRITSHWDGLNWDALDKVSKQRYDGVAMELRLEILPHFHQELQKARAEAQKEYKQFVLNVLDGVDIADGQCNTKAIRFALQSRTIHSELDQDNLTN